MSRNLSRREILGMALSLTGLGGAYGIFQATNIAVDKGLIPQAGNPYFTRAGAKRIMHSPRQAVDEFRTVRQGGMSFWYQNFWKFTREPSEMNELDQLSAQLLDGPEFAENPHRIRVLPIIARIHALSSGDEEDLIAYRQSIHRMHEDAVSDGPNANRLIIDMIWQNATAALIRNQEAWRHTTFDNDLVEDAESVCTQFLDGRVELFMSAIASWQFLLTYERAVAERKDPKELHLVRQSISRIVEQRLGKQSYWFRGLQKIYRSRMAFDRMLPQMNEVVLGMTTPSVLGREATDFFLRVRVQQAQIGHSIKSTRLRIPHAWTISGGERSYTILMNYGFSAQDWERLKVMAPASDPRLGLSRDAYVYWEERASSEEQPDERTSDFEIADRPNVPVFQALFPFRTIEAQEFAHKVLGNNVSLTDVAEIVARSMEHENSLGALWAPLASAAGGKTAQALGLRQSELRGLGDLGMELEAPKELVAPHKEFLHRIWEEYLKPLVQPSVSVPGTLRSAADISDAPAKVSSDGTSEPLNWSAVRTDLSEETKMTEKHSSGSSDPIPPGTYSPETLPPISPGARAFLDRVEKRAKQEEEKYPELHRLADRRPSGKPARGLRLVDQGGVGLRLTDSGGVGIILDDENKPHHQRPSGASDQSDDTGS